MAIVVLPEGQQRSGAQGGIVWSHNRGGPYVRNRAIPTNPNTDRQVAVRNVMQNLSIRWQNTLTQDQRDAWDEYASNVSWMNALGQATSLSGMNHYIRSNTPRVLCELAILDDAPTIFNLAQSEMSLGGSGSELAQTIVVTFDDTADWCSEDGAFQVVQMGIPQNASRKFFKGPYRILTCIPGDSLTPPTSPLAGVAPPGWPFAEGQRIWLQSRIGRADGRLSEFAQVNFLAGA